MRTSELNGAGVVVTGAGAGIGAALARGFAAAGARVVVNDIDVGAAKPVARDVGGSAVVGDMSDPEFPRQLVATSLAELGRIDLFCGNAGVFGRGGPELGDSVWDRQWQINVMAHVRSFRELLPMWEASRKGHYLMTVSATGLLSRIGDAPYATTKHAAQGLAEWLHFTYAHLGVTVQSLCPRAVVAARQPQEGGQPETSAELDVVTPENVAGCVLANLGGPFLILPHPEVADYFAFRAAQPDAWLERRSEESRRLAESELPPVD
ncbi:MAG: SDR family oxidoreductase [Candidatus Nanopelagicales bacterium]|nr:SDR family oxidoreductase [Candidatus Nanopelagicales bacterium]